MRLKMETKKKKKFLSFQTLEADPTARIIDDDLTAATKRAEAAAAKAASHHHDALWAVDWARWLLGYMGENFYLFDMAETMQNSHSNI